MPDIYINYEIIVDILEDIGCSSCFCLPHMNNVNNQQPDNTTQSRDFCHHSVLQRKPKWESGNVS